MAGTRGYIVLTLEFHKDQRRWVGRCRELGTSTYAATLERTTAELEELIALHLDELEQAGERERFFARHGITLYLDEPSQVERTLPVDYQSLYVLAKSVPIHAHRGKLVTA